MKETSKKLDSPDFWRISNRVLKKCKSDRPPQFKGPKVLSTLSDKIKFFTVTFSKNSDVDNSDIS